jgi:hypothetical protein
MIRCGLLGRRHRKTNRADNPVNRLFEPVYGAGINTGAVLDLQSLTVCADPDPAAWENSEGVGTSSSGLVQVPAPFLARHRLGKGTLCNLDPSDVQKIVRRYEIWALQCARQGSPNTDNLLTLVQFNVFRALASNDSALGFNMEWMSCDAVSPFNTMNQEDFGISLGQSPPALRPTALQRVIPHHPWLDLFPFPTMRNNILRMGEDFDDSELCFDLAEFCMMASDDERAGLVVWGDPSDPSNWEVSEGFLKKWAWVIRGCREVFASTNHWRQKRGEKRLFFL